MKEGVGGRGQTQGEVVRVKEGVGEGAVTG